MDQLRDQLAELLNPAAGDDADRTPFMVEVHFDVKSFEIGRSADFAGK